MRYALCGQRGHGEPGNRGTIRGNSPSFEALEIPMTSYSTQRHSPRYPLQLPVLHRLKTSAPTGTGVGWTRNLSEGGACVELAERLRPKLPLWVRLQTDGAPIELEAEVTWADGPGPPGSGLLHGVAFTQTPPETRAAIQHLLLSKGFVRPARVRLPFEVPVTCQARGKEGPPLPGRTRDLSRGGLLLRLPQVVPPGTVLEVTLTTLAGPLTVEGTVAWVAPPEGRTPGGPIRHGLRLTQPPWSTSLALGGLVTERG